MSKASVVITAKEEKKGRIEYSIEAVPLLAAKTEEVVRGMLPALFSLEADEGRFGVEFDEEGGFVVISEGVKVGDSDLVARLNNLVQAMMADLEVFNEMLLGKDLTAVADKVVDRIAHEPALFAELPNLEVVVSGEVCPNCGRTDCPAHELLSGRTEFLGGGMMMFSGPADSRSPIDTIIGMISGKIGGLFSGTSGKKAPAKLSVSMPSAFLSFAFDRDWIAEQVKAALIEMVPAKLKAWIEMEDAAVLNKHAFMEDDRASYSHGLLIENTSRYLDNYDQETERLIVELEKRREMGREQLVVDAHTEHQRMRTNFDDGVSALTERQAKLGALVKASGLELELASADLAELALSGKLPTDLLAAVDQFRAAVDQCSDEPDPADDDDDDGNACTADPAAEPEEVSAEEVDPAAGDDNQCTSEPEPEK